jgi:hypothetical protein
MGREQKWRHDVFDLHPLHLPFADIHSMWCTLPGYAVMYCMISFGFGAYGAILAAGIVACAVAILLDIGIEKPFIQKRADQPRPKI